MGEGVSDQLRDAVESARSGDDAGALEILRSLVEAIDDTNNADLLEGCVGLARELNVRDLELHFALCKWSARPGNPSALDDVVLAAAQTEAVRAAVWRLCQGEARAEDWCEIAAADPYATWSTIEAICGPGNVALLTDLKREGRISAADDAERLAWHLRDARVTCAGRSVAVGAAAADPSSAGTSGGTTFIPALSTWDPSAALKWAGSDGHRWGSARIALLATAFRFSGYWHWVLEGLTKAVRLDEAGLLDGGTRLVIALDRRPPPFILESLAASGIDPSIVTFAMDGFDACVDELVFPTRHRSAGRIVEPEGPTTVEEAMLDNASHGPDRDIEILRRRLGVASPSKSTGRRLLVSRGDADTRRVTNEAALAESLRRFGFESVVLSRMPFVEQVEAFSAAEIVIGPHGAGLTNLMFANRGAAAIELHHIDRPLPHFERIAHRAGVTYRRLPCHPDPVHPDDMVVDAEIAVSLVSRLIDGAGPR